MKIPNEIRVSYTKEEQSVIDKGLAAHRHLIRTIDYWIDIGRAMNVLFEKAKRLGRKGFVELQIQEGFCTRDETPIHAGLISRARKMADQAAEVMAWHDKLPGKQQQAWNNPNSVFAHCPLFASEQDEKENDNPELFDDDPSPTRFASHDQMALNQLREENAELRKEIVRLKARIAELEAAGKAPTDACVRR